MSELDLKYLESLAKAATQGPWNYSGCEVFLKGTDSWPVIANCRNENDSSYIASANPAVVLELIAMCHHLRWTTETPTEEGWYWNRVAGRATIIVKLYYDSNGEFYYRVAGLPDDCWLVESLADEPECQWAGPIPEPEEKK